MELLDRLGKLAFYRRELQNWTAVVGMHVHGRSVQHLLLRDGHTIHLLDAKHEIWAFDAIYRHRCYDVDFRGLPADGTVVDLGANVGIFTLLAATRLVPQGRVLAIEANPECFDLLQQTITGCKNVVSWCGALGGTGTLWLAADSLSSSIFRGHDAVRPVETPSISIERVLPFGPRIDLLKANIEGAEYPMLLDSAPELWTRVDRLVVKWHKDGDVADGHHPDELAHRMTELGFRVLRHEDIWMGPDITTGITTATR